MEGTTSSTPLTFWASGNRNSVTQITQIVFAIEMLLSWNAMNYVRPYLKNDDDSDDDDDECMIKTELAAACHSQRRPQEAGEQAGEIHFKG